MADVAPQATAARVAALRKRRTASGLTRLEVYAHPDDHAPIKAHAARLARKRAKAGLATERNVQSAQAARSRLHARYSAPSSGSQNTLHKSG
jgi:hypothetical protein